LRRNKSADLASAGSGESIVFLVYSQLIQSIFSRVSPIYRSTLPMILRLQCYLAFETAPGRIYRAPTRVSSSIFALILCNHFATSFSLRERYRLLPPSYICHCTQCPRSEQCDSHHERNCGKIHR
jgi:hypothetical protein